MGLTNAYRDHITKATIGSSVTAFSNANAYIGVGGGASSTTAFAASQTDLQGASKPVRQWTRPIPPIRRLHRTG